MSNSIIINSDKRTSQLDSPTLYKILFEFPIEKGNYTLKYVYIPYTITTINKNNQTFLVNGSTITIQTGDYLTVETLRVAVENALKSYDVNFTVIVFRNVFTINNTTNFILDFTNKDAGIVLGFQKRLYTSALYQTGTGLVNLNPLTSINIIINNRCTIRDNSNLAYSFRIPVISNKNSFITYESNLWQQQINFTADQSMLNIRLTDDSFRTIDTQNIDWWMVLEKE